MKLTFFPDPYPDEILYSVLARYHQRSGNTSFRQTQIELYGSSTAKAVIDLPSRISELCKRMPKGACYNTDALIMGQTLLPYYSSFMPIDRVKTIKSDMVGRKGGSIHTRVGIPAGGVCNTRTLKFCPACLLEDEIMFGEPYWHRLHQAPGVFICPKHSLFLELDCPWCGPKLLPDPTQQYQLADIQCKQGHDLRYPKCGRLIDLERHTHKFLLDLAQDIQWILDHPRNIVDLTEIREKYISFLQYLDLALPSGRVRFTDLTHELSAYYPLSLLELLETSTNPGKTDWLGKMLRKPKGIIHPIRHLLLMRFVAGSPERFWSDICYRPFGKGPWPCLNPVAKHYRQDVVQTCNLTKDSKSLKPVGTFICDCGFIYSRSGPDLITMDRYKFGCIKAFGHLWQNKLRELIVEQKLSYRATAGIMKADPVTIKRYVMDLGLPYAYGSNVNIEPEVVSKNKGLQLKVNKEEYRKRILETISANPDDTRTQIRKRVPGVYIWLYKKDKEWLDKALPRPIKNHVYTNTRVDWDTRDQDIFYKLKQAADDLLSLVDPPVRITLSRLGRKMGLLALLENFLDKLPKTKALLNDLSESVEDFQIRRVQLAAQRLAQEGKEIVPWRLEREAGLRPGYSKRVLLAMEYEMTKPSQIEIITAFKDSELKALLRQ